MANFKHFYAFLITGQLGTPEVSGRLGRGDNQVGDTED